MKTIYIIDANALIDASKYYNMKNPPLLLFGLQLKN